MTNWGKRMCFIATRSSGDSFSDFTDFFFFSSRRRHTRFDCDWSSDVCSSDLSEIALASDMTFVSRGKAVLSQWEVGIGLVAGGGPMARLPLLMGRGRALEVLLSSDDIGGELAETYGRSEERRVGKECRSRWSP